MIFTLAFQNDAYAQARGKKKKKPSRTDQYFDDSGFANKLWYGGTIGLPSFFGGREFSVFSTGLAPMVGYKVLGDIVSVGPRVSLDYFYVKGFAVNAQTGQIVRDARGNALAKKANTFSYSVGAFARAKATRSLFAHLEYENQHTREIPTVQGFLLYDQVDDAVVTVKRVRDNVYVGAGYNSSSGLLGWELLILYNVNAPENTIDLPFVFRIGLNYKF